MSSACEQTGVASPYDIYRKLLYIFIIHIDTCMCWRQHDTLIKMSTRYDEYILYQHDEHYDYKTCIDKTYIMIR